MNSKSEGAKTAIGVKKREIERENLMALLDIHLPSDLSLVRKGPRPSREGGRKGRRKGGGAGGVGNEGIPEGVRNGGR